MKMTYECVCLVGHSGTFWDISCRRNVPATERAEFWSPSETMLEHVFLVVKLALVGEWKSPTIIFLRLGQGRRSLRM